MIQEINLRPRLKPLAGPAAYAHAAVLSLAVGYAVMVVVHRPPLAAMLGGALLATPLRSELVGSLGLWSVATAILLALGLKWAQRGGRDPTTLGELVAGLWPLTLLPLAFYVFSIPAWSASPVLLYAITTAACGYCVLRTEIRGRERTWSIPPPMEKAGTWVLLGAAIAAYVIYVSIHTIQHHLSLGTSAFDLGIQENILWNTVHGDILYSSLMGGNYLGIHTSLVLLLVAPIYALAPSTETLLAFQATALGVAALPLYLLARTVLDNSRQGLLVALLWLTHPAVAGANFYDFHPIACAPVFLFTAVYFWWLQRWTPFWISIALLLSVKEELSIIVVLLGIVTLMSGNRRKGFQILAVGVAAYVVLQHLVIPHFAGGAHSYSWYYSEIIPSGEGPRGLVTTVLLNPVFALEFILTQAKALYVFQLFAPLALLPFFTARGAILISYGLAATLLASRPPLHQIGFQYALTLLALGFVGALLALVRFSDDGRRRALIAAVLLAVVTCYHYGMIWPRHHFTGGFSTIDFDYSERDRERYRELKELIEQIPPEDTVLASENLVPHVAQRHIVETTRHVRDRKFPHYDSILVVNDGEAQRLRGTPGLNGLRDHEIAARSERFILFRAPQTTTNPEEAPPMPSIYDIKPAFQNLLRPLADGLVRAGITPNQVTVAAFILSALGGVAIALRPNSTWPLLALPVVLFIRMALNALDGMMAREHDLASPAGAILNEAGDVAADAALYLPLALVPSLNTGAVVMVVVLAGLTELVGLAGATLGASRRYDGPMGKSDRAFGISVLAIAAAVWPAGTPVLTGVLAVIIALEVLTIANRARSALKEIEK